MYPLTDNLLNTDTIAWNEHGDITHAQFLTDVYKLTQLLPEKKFAINLCEKRYNFMVVFAAVIVRLQTNLLPQNRSVENLLGIAEEYEDCYTINEEKLETLNIEQFVLDEDLFASRIVDEHISTPEIPSNHLAALVFTSGSTGKPQANNKTWKALVCGARMAAEFFKLADNPVHIIATVPPQHMYGLESSVLYCLQNGCPIYNGKPFYPEDIRLAARQAKQPVVLVTTPVHLRACSKVRELSWENIKFVISATAPLRELLAKEVTSLLKTRIFEIYGCTEAGAIAARETINSTKWNLYKGIKIHQHDNKTFIELPFFDNNIEVNDVIDVVNDSQFRLVGRCNDMVNIAGKRGSLADLTMKLQSIDGIDDAVVYLPDEENEINRLVAFIVAKNVDEVAISNELAKSVDRVFIPRPIFNVKALPYNETGKLTRKDLVKMHQQCK